MTQPGHWKSPHCFRKGFLLLSIFSLVSVAQSQIASDFQSLGVDQGLSQNSVYALYQDSRGFLWIGTADGLNRYDGRTIKTYKSLLNISEPFNANFIRGNIVEDKRGNIWYTSEDGLYMYDRQMDKVVPKHIFTRQEIADFKLTFISSDGKVWMFGVVYGFASYSIADGRFEMIPHGIPFNFRDIVSTKTIQPDKDESIWFAVKRNDGLYRFNTETKTSEHFFQNEDLSTILFVPGGHYRAGSRTVVFYDSASHTSRVLPIQLIDADVQPTASILTDHAHRVWIATPTNGLLLYDPITKQTSSFRSDAAYPSLPGNRLTGLLLDNQDNLWISTDGAGVCKLNIQSLIFKSTVPAKPNIFVKSITEDQKGNIIVASLENPVYIINPATGKMTEDHYLNRLGISNASRIYWDSESKLWIVQGNLISLVDSTKKRIVAHGTLFPQSSAEIHKLHELKSGQMAVATAVGLIFITVKGNRIFTTYQIDHFQASGLLETDDGNLWVGSRYSGLNRLEKSDNGIYKVEKVLFPHLNVNSIHQDEQDADVIWLASTKGLIRLNTHSESFQVYSESNGMGNNYVYGILEDHLHRLWLSTNGGISCFTKSTETFLNYTNKDGLQSNEFNTGAFLKDRSGLLYFGGINGVNWFNPEEVTASRQPPPVSITEISINDVALTDSVIQSGSLTLPHFKNDLLIRFSVFDFTKPSSNKIRYRLIGFENKIRNADVGEAVYNNLPPGQYQLVFSASNTSNVWSDDQIFEITIQAPFWKQTWFYVVVIILSAGVIILITWLFLRSKYLARIAVLEKLRAIDEERQRISREMHDDIGAGLTQISLISESVKSKSKNDGKELDEIADTSRKLVHSISEIIWSLNPESKNLQQVIAHLREQLHSLLEHSGINYSIVLPENIEPVAITNEQRRNLLLVAREIVHNAIKHSRASNIAVHGSYVNSVLEMEIKDDGIGFSLEGLPRGNGLKNIRLRVNQMNGILNIRSDGQSGTVFKWTVRLPQKQI
jgi:signal transduction histidine kinase/ligand-binding sensor domain-containing protein